jgi:hypothetical protein
MIKFISEKGKMLELIVSESWLKIYGLWSLASTLRSSTSLQMLRNTTAVLCRELLLSQPQPR